MPKRTKDAGFKLAPHAKRTKPKSNRAQIYTRSKARQQLKRRSGPASNTRNGKRPAVRQLIKAASVSNKKKVAAKDIKEKILALVSDHKLFIQSDYFKYNRAYFPNDYAQRPFLAVTHPVAIEAIIHYWLNNDKKTIRLMGFLGVPICISKMYGKSSSEAEIRITMDSLILSDTFDPLKYRSMIRCLNLNQLKAAAELWIKGQHYGEGLESKYQQLTSETESTVVSQRVRQISILLQDTYQDQYGFQALRCVQMLLSTMFFAEGSRVLVLPNGIDAHANYAIRFAQLALLKISEVSSLQSRQLFNFIKTIFPAVVTWKKQQDRYKAVKEGKGTPRSKRAATTPSSDLKSALNLDYRKKQQSLASDKKREVRRLSL